MLKTEESSGEKNFLNNLYTYIQMCVCARACIYRVVGQGDKVLGRKMFTLGYNPIGRVEEKYE